jgi:hypothetical protein
VTFSSRLQLARRSIYLGLALGAFACGPDDAKDDGNTAENNSTPTSNNQTSGNNTTAGNQTTSENSTTPAENNTSVNHTSANNQTSDNATTPAGNMDPMMSEEVQAYLGLMNRLHEFSCERHSCETDPFAFTGQSERYASVEECVTLSNEALLESAWFERATLGLESGAFTYDAGHLSRCVATLDGWLQAPDICAVEDWVDDLLRCQNIFHGALQEETACAFDIECQEGLFCMEGDQRGACTGECQRRHDDPAWCGDTYCDPFTSYCFKETETCEVFEPLGAVCQDVGACGLDASCEEDMENPGQRYCAENNSLAQGDSCSTDSACGQGLRCSFQGICEPRPAQTITEQAAGEPCNNDPVDSLRCDEGLVCADYLFDSTAGMFQGTCASPRAAGEACTHTSDCEAGLTCSGATFDTAMSGECVNIIPSGEACARDIECATGACDSGVCAPLMGCGP